MEQPLVVSAEMTGFPGAPFPENVLESAAESVRDDCGWHIAPEVTETVTRSATGTIVYLRSLKVTQVTAVRNAETGEVLEDWRLDEHTGILHRSTWPRTVEVDLTHGYATCPAALKPMIADRANAMARGGYVQQESLGSRSVSLGRLGSDAAKYVLPPRP